MIYVIVTVTVRKYTNDIVMILSSMLYFIYFFIRCVWDGDKCGNGTVTQQITDMGLCVTFNADKTNYKTTNKTGKLKSI